MDENLHDIEDLFHSALNDDEETPSPKAWEEIDKRLDKESVVSINKKYTNLKRIAILLLLLLGISVYEMNRINNRNNLAENNKRASENQKKSAKPNDKILRESEGVTPLKPGDSKNFNNNDIAMENRLPADSFNNSSQKTGVGDHTPANNKRAFVEKYTDQKSQSKNINQKIQTVFNSSKNVMLTSETFLKSKIKNDNPAEDNRLISERKSIKEYQQIPYYKIPQNALGEILTLQSKKFIELNNPTTLLLATTTKLIDTGARYVAQIKANNKQRLSRFSITPFFSPDIAWYHLQNETTNNQSVNAAGIEQEETHEFSSTSGILADYKINKHWGLQSGITLSSINIVTEPKTIYAQPDNSGSIKYRINTSSGYGYILPAYSANPVIGDSLYAFTSTHSLRYIGIPVSVTWSFVKNKFTIGAKAGVSANFLTKARLETTVEKGFDNSVETVNSIQGLKKVYISGLAGIGIDFKLNKKLFLAFVPTMRFALNSINKNATVKSFPMSFGSSVGLKIEL